MIGLRKRLIEDEAIEDAMKAAASGAVQKGLNAALDVIEFDISERPWADLWIRGGPCGAGRVQHRRDFDR